MRILHTSDWHLGHELHGYNRAVEHDAFLDWLLHIITEKSVDALIITGDLYDVANPPVEAQHRFYAFLHDALAQSPHLQIVAIGGNHDSAARVELPQVLMDDARVHIVGSMPRRGGFVDPDRVVFQLKDKFGNGGAICAAVPFLRHGDFLQPVSNEHAVAALYEAVFDRASRLAANSGLPILITGHLHVVGGAVSDVSERRIFVGGQEAIPTDVFPSGVAYVALGHLHRPQEISQSPLIRYAGAPFPMALDERTYEHSVVLLETAEQDVQVRVIHTPRVVQFLRVPELGAAPLEEVESLLASLNIGEVDADHKPFLEVSVQLSTAEPDLRRRIEAALNDKPVRLARISRPSPGVGGTLADDVDVASDLLDLEPEEVFQRLHHKQFQTQPADDLLTCFRELVSASADPLSHEVGAK
ncbi:MAG: exonuclease SbcCD subunit D C-terminal domain-containing protein [Terriglobales bacterium]